MKENKSYKLIDLWPYKIKNIENFYHRDHPVNLNPKSSAYKKYWLQEFTPKMIEGWWVNDEGTWVFMPPKLFFYGNYGKIRHKIGKNKNKLEHPDIRDNEWIVFNYVLCCQGFSGFELDEEYTCNDLVRRLEDDEPLNRVEIAKITDTIKKADGSYKKYIDPWTYLRTHYLIDEPAKEPLGLPLYENEMSDGVLLSARWIGKSSMVLAGDFPHEFLTSGVKRMSEIDQVNAALNFSICGVDGRQLGRSISNISAAYNKMPGRFKYGEGKSDFPGPFYKNYQGTWTVGNEVRHIVKDKSGKPVLEGSVVQMRSITPDATTVGAGDRFVRMYWEEFGFLEYALEIYANNKDSLRLDEKVGMAFYLGTGGDSSAIREPKMIFENPSEYDVFGIPDYFGNQNRKTGLFIPAYYQKTTYKDKNGNTYLEEAFEDQLTDRAKKQKNSDSYVYAKHVMYNPLNPEDMLTESGESILPKQEAADRLSQLGMYGVFEKEAMVGRLKYNQSKPRGVEFEKDLSGSCKPILQWGLDRDKVDMDGAFVMYEEPGAYTPDNLYWVIYDPAAKSGEGSSYHSIIVYKYFYKGNEESLEDNIVAEWIGRKTMLNDNYEEVIKIAKYYNAKIFPETNVAGFIEWASDKGYWNMMEGDAYKLEQEISTSTKRSFYKKGFTMTGGAGRGGVSRKKWWCLQKLHNWLMTPVDWDKDGIPIKKKIDTIYSPMILDEIRNYNSKDNFDHISSLLGLMLLIGKFDMEPIALDIEDPNEIPYYEYEEPTSSIKRGRAGILKY